MIRPAAAWLALLLLLPGHAMAEERVGVRIGEHAGHARLVFDWPRETAYSVQEEAGRVTLRFARPAAFDLSAARRGLRNLRGIEATGETVTLTLAPGTRLRHFRLGGRVVLDLLDGAPETPAAPGPAPASAPPAAVRAPAQPAARATPPAPRAAQPAAPGAAPVTPAATPAAAPPPAPAPAPTPATTPSIPSTPAPRLPALQEIAGRLLVPAGPEVGAALLRRGGTWLLVLDAPLALDPTPPRAEAFAGLSFSTGPAATVLRLSAAALPEPVLTREPRGWLVEPAAAPPVLLSIRPELEAGPPPRLMLRAERPAHAVAVLDPETGGTLLVGTLRAGGEASPVGRRNPAFEILPTRLGAALLPRADTVTLRALPAGFAAAAGPGASLALGPDSPMQEAAGLSRLFDLPGEALPGLLQRERNAMLAVAAAPPLGRGPPRLRAAEALLALGLGAEAQAMAALAQREDPRLAEDAFAQALQGAAALLAGRPAEAQGLLNPRLPASDELRLWRGLLAAARGEDGAAAIAAGLPLLQAWPAPLAARLAPLAAESLAAAEPAAARRLLAGREADAGFALARARLLEAEGARDAALAAYDAVIRGRDRRARAAAMRRAVELRLASGALDAAGAAAAMEAVLPAWRGDGAESAARLRLAELRQAAGDPRGAFEMLRETEAAFPDLAATLRPRQQQALLAALEAEPPIAAVALFETHHALLPPGPASESALATLADRLAALDLAGRARQVLGRALARAEGAEARAALGLRLAELALGADDPAGARAALADTAAPELPAPLLAARHLAEARALSRQGATEAAAALYRALGPAAGPELAEMLAARQDWAGAAEALGAHLAAALPPAPSPIPDALRPLVARAAALLAMAGDETGLAALRDAVAARMAGGAFEEAFALITAGRLGGIGELPRLRQELELARALPARLESLRASPGAAR
jgi:hypothetical protein